MAMVDPAQESRGNTFPAEKAVGAKILVRGDQESATVLPARTCSSWRFWYKAQKATQASAEKVWGDYKGTESPGTPAQHSQVRLSEPKWSVLFVSHPWAISLLISICSCLVYFRLYSSTSI